MEAIESCAVGAMVPMPTLPALVTINRDVVAKLATLDSWKSWAVPLLEPATSRRARGLEVPMPTLPVPDVELRRRCPPAT